MCSMEVPEVVVSVNCLQNSRKGRIKQTVTHTNYIEHHSLLSNLSVWSGLQLALTPPPGCQTLIFLLVISLSCRLKHETQHCNIWNNMYIIYIHILLNGETILNVYAHADTRLSVYFSILFHRFHMYVSLHLISLVSLHLYAVVLAVLYHGLIPWGMFLSSIEYHLFLSLVVCDIYAYTHTVVLVVLSRISIAYKYIFRCI